MKERIFTAHEKTLTTAIARVLVLVILSLAETYSKYNLRNKDI